MAGGKNDDKSGKNVPERRDKNSDGGYDKVTNREERHRPVSDTVPPPRRPKPDGKDKP